MLRLVLLELARNRNKIPLPKSVAGPGIPLPPEQDTLISPNYQLALPRRQVNSNVEETEEEEDAEKTNTVNPNVSQEQRVEQQSHHKVSFALPSKRIK
ncbi:unnamed protein product [Victoria cruziana]